ncbi:glycosyltransferase family 2 protein [Ammoniphilus resinae]|uniref:Glycosyltransferase involved in cell wall biosynthesis n=1 Tax=Ammoniphilus resinae TaxID=861532 RepID=A0ABS4GSZ6_9BACL|nr:glycosyltransferase family 2 protein [Ammoniphilus resinae]MBP1933391.1 glycosyltransferase involved in cell wall biosynthesis [Ammoniphilus resinae]
MGKPKITVVIPSYNRAEYIEKAVRSVLKQSHPRWKLLIIDDASTDDTVSRLQKYLTDERIRMISLSENAGISRVMNRALEEVDTEAFLQLDSDDWLEKDTIKRFVKAMKKNPKAALYYGNIRLWIPNRKNKWSVHQIIRHRKFSNKYQFLCYMTYMLHPRCYRTEAVRAVGGWQVDDPYDGRIMEDRRICVKLIEKYPFHWINKIMYNRRKHRDQLTNRKGYEARNQLRKELVKKSLKSWGSKYTPVFSYRNGLLIVKRLVRRKNRS